MAVSSLKKESRVIPIMRGWGDWLRSDKGGALGYGGNVIARLMAGMQSTRCPKCGGDGEVLQDFPNGARHRVLCPRCEGAGRIDLRPRVARTGRDCPDCKTTPGRLSDGRTCLRCCGRGRIRGDSIHDKINPAHIPSTHIAETGDDLYLRVDAIVCSLPHLLQLVAWQEYWALGREQDKYRRIGVGRLKYISTLDDLHDAVEEGLA
jgi:hypothetical protein